MKVVHLCLASFYIDNGSYQENLLPRYHKRDGYDVEIIASPDVFDGSGCLIIGDAPLSYFNEDGIPVKRLQYRHAKIDRKLKRFNGVFPTLLASKPDIIFIHGCQFLDIFEVIRYLRLHTETSVFVDNHADFSNSAKSIVSKYVLHRILWRICAQSILPYVKKFYGVLPSRVDFLYSEYNIPKKDIELLVMGADDDLLIRNTDNSSLVRKTHGIVCDDFFIVTGGKFDNAKLEVLDLMRAVNETTHKSIKLLLFGSLVPDIADEFNSLLSDKVIYVGWISAKESYSYFDAADLVVFPGRHSVFWEQVVAQKKPLLVKLWEGTTHIDVGGNVLFLVRSDKNEIKEKLIYLIDNPSVMESLQSSAESSKSEDFLYSKISRISLQND